jgi:hypothetical protein
MASKEVKVASVFRVECFKVIKDILGQFDWLARGFEHKLEGTLVMVGELHG